MLLFVQSEEKEKLNIWTALMNLENLYGTEESLLKVFEAALQQNEPVVVFFKLVNIYIQSKKFEVSSFCLFYFIGYILYVFM